MSSSPPSSPSRHHRSSSHASASSPRPSSPPTQTFHPNILPIPTPALVDSVAGAAHYSGIRVDSPDTVLKHRHSSHDRRGSQVVDLKADHHRILADLKELYCCKPTVELLERSWHKDAIFEDPWAKCKGYSEYAAMWFALPKLFSKSETLSTRVMTSTVNPNQIMYFQKQEYTYRLFGRKKVVESIIVVELDENDKITRLVDQREGKLPSWFGSHFLRRLNAKVAPWLISVPKKSNTH
ncbi:hypothetical protein HGRIS_009179 [Hohenbuehelia grisea]|uniref:Uncharacterized protein n=1 Tax=Hohenbuehelia grisea TaxID=104357 RepID=A0ABR3J0P0_9AGAR